MESKSRIIDLIRKCLAKGDSTRNNSEAEVEVALATAQRLMAEHNIVMTEVQYDAEHGTLKEPVGEREFGVVKNSPWRLLLPRVVNALCNTAHYWHIDYAPGTRLKIKFLRFVGMPSDVELASEIYQELCFVVKKLERGYKGNQRSFSYGVVTRLLHKAEEIKKAETRPANTTALMVVKDKEISSYLSRLGLKSGRPARVNQNSDYSAGYKAGDSVALRRSTSRSISGTRQLTYK